MLKEQTQTPLQPKLATSNEPDTQPKHFLATARKYSHRVAMRKKHLGIWRECTWAESLAHVKNFCLGLVTLGLERGKRVVIIGDNDPQWYWTSLATQSAGGTAVGCFIDSTPPEVLYIASHCDAVIAVAKDQEQVDKFLEIREQLPLIKKVIYWDDRGMWGYRDPWLMRFEEVEKLGQELDAHEPGLFEESVAQGKGEDIAIMCYTSGTTDNPKGAMIRHRNLLQAYSSYNEIETRRPTDEHLSVTPMAWITENSFGVTAHCMVGNPVNFPEEVETAFENLREIAPHNIIYASRIWENIVSMVQAKMMDSGLLKRLLYRIFMPIGYKRAELRVSQNGSSKSGRRKFLWLPLVALSDLLVFAPLRDKLGLSRVRTAITVGSMLSPEVIRFFHAIGVNLKQIYGSTEMIYATIHRDNDIRFESVGKPVPTVQVRIGEDSEIQVKSPSIFAGYYKNPEATARALRDGWYHSGDAGYMDADGHLIYLDRVVDMLELAGGQKYSPQYIEGQLKFSPYIKDAMALGGKDKPFVAAIINIDFENVGRWAESKHITYSTFADLSQKPQVYALIQQDVERLNRTLQEAARVKRYLLLHKEFDPDEAEMTRTRKLRRAFIEKKYADLIAAIYGGKDEFVTEAEVKYRDGRTGRVKTAIRIHTPA